MAAPRSRTSGCARCGTRWGKQLKQDILALAQTNGLLGHTFVSHLRRWCCLPACLAQARVHAAASAAPWHKQVHGGEFGLDMLNAGGSFLTEFLFLYNPKGRGLPQHQPSLHFTANGRRPFESHNTCFKLFNPQL